jgi:hypothetical protein
MKWTHLIHCVYLPLIQLYFARQLSGPLAALDDRDDDLLNALVVTVESTTLFQARSVTRSKGRIH